MFRKPRTEAEPRSCGHHPVRTRLGPEHDAPLNQHDAAVQEDAQDREYDEEREHGRDLQIGIVDQEQIAEPAARADELADDRADDAQDDPDVEAGEDEREAPSAAGRT